MKEYDPNRDYCGPSNNWLAGFVSNKPWGADINRCCYVHDREYERGGTGEDRLKADEHFRDWIEGNLSLKWWIPRWLARRVAWRYFTAVRIFGSKNFNYAEEKNE